MQSKYFKKEIQSGELYKLHDKLISDLNSTFSEWENLEKEKENLLSKQKRISS